MTLLQKIQAVENLPGCGWAIRAEARIAMEALRIEMKRHAQAMRDIEERFALEWRHVEQNWSKEEIEEAAK